MAIWGKSRPKKFEKTERRALEKRLSNCNSASKKTKTLVQKKAQTFLGKYKDELFQTDNKLERENIIYEQKIDRCTRVAGEWRQIQRQDIALRKWMATRVTCIDNFMAPIWYNITCPPNVSATDEKEANGSNMLPEPWERASVHYSQPFWKLLKIKTLFNYEQGGN